MKNCSACGFEAENIGALSKHRNTTHPELKRAYTRRAKTTPPTESGSEMKALAGCVDSFERGQLDDAARRRVITYLNDRYLPDVAEEEE